MLTQKEVEKYWNAQTSRQANGFDYQLWTPHSQRLVVSLSINVEPISIPLRSAEHLLFSHRFLLSEKTNKITKQNTIHNLHFRQPISS